MKNKNQPAFANHSGRDGEIGVYEFDKGLTKREYFAGLAMQGLCTATKQDGEWNTDPKSTAIEAVEYADELLKALESEIVKG